MNIRYESAYFKIYEPAEGVFAVIDNGGQQNAGSNAGIIDLGGTTLLFDALMNYDAACELKNACLKLTGRYPVYLINSHNHIDHVAGNKLFKDSGASLISSMETRKALVSMGTETQKTAICPAAVTFERNMIIHGDKRSVQLHSIGTGHSDGDVIACLPEQKICFTGDLLFSDSHPWLGSGRPGKVIDVLNEMLKWNMEYFIPGHGPVSTSKDVALMVQYIKEIIDLVRKKGSIIADDYTIEDISPVFKDWKQVQFFKKNISFLAGIILKPGQ